MDEMLTVLEEVKNSVKQEHQEAQQKIAALGRQIEFDRTCVADRVTAIKKAVSSREWLTEGRGSYEWDDDKWHEEFAAAAKEILEALAPLERIAADWSNCPRDTESVARARVDLEAEDRRLRAHNQQLMENLSWAMDLLDMYDKKLVEMGEPEWVVNAVIHLQAKAKAREALK
jgi:chromosome segregation ATPase